jgi:hypothetical protein
VELALRALARVESDTELAKFLLIWIECHQPVGVIRALDKALDAPAGAPAIFVPARGRVGEGLPGKRERVRTLAKIALGRSIGHGD